ncbi:MAG: electron transfer flavoprotein-ubiquinone oxidoreductase [Candidatus Eremiobacteraeota bacterium]|nr:electron transfer flavoprotein-ubiquinone oxidoreductase [Candidatus Eremiobacteraeota bacterium]MBV8498275.1 electron transfer flavoprotein-ubiquinone oxidoreductase [Candidatus Eremiobacteraeota bacterium]
MAERDRLEVDVLFVGAGPASLAGAIRLGQLAQEAGRALEIMVIEKGAEIGNHGLSGAVMDPRALDELLPAWRDGAPVESPVTSDELWFLTARGKIKAPFVPPPLRNRGKYVTSLQKLCKWLGERAEEVGAQVFPAFPGQELLWHEKRVIGVRTGDKGLDHNGQPKTNYEPGADILAKVVVLGEGPRGTLAKQAAARLALDAGREPQVYAAGVKELWQLPDDRFKAGAVIHTLGYPLPPETFGGGFIYGMSGNVLDIGFVTGLDYKNPTTDPHNELQRMKLHPAVAKMLEGAKLIRYGAKAIPEGGLFAMPRAYADGLLIVGDSAGFLNGMRLKGIHLGMKSGMQAAETIWDALAAGTCDAATLSSYERRFKDSWAFEELRGARNFHQGFAKGLLPGLINAGLSTLRGGAGFGFIDKLPGEPGYARMAKMGWPPKETPRAPIDNVLTFDKLTDVYNSGTMHEENQPCHLIVADTNICRDRCTTEYGNPCRYFCPAAVYEPMFEPVDATFEGRLQINFTNCVHCKTCDIADPYQIITWVPPQGGEGPVYTGM